MMAFRYQLRYHEYGCASVSLQPQTVAAILAVAAYLVAVARGLRAGCGLKRVYDEGASLDPTLSHPASGPDED